MRGKTVMGASGQLLALIWEFVKRDLLARYKGSAFGTAWAVLHPLILLGLYSFVFSTILRVRVGEGEGTTVFALYLFCGMLPWNAFAEGLNRSTGVLLEHVNLIKRTVFPVEILPIYPVVGALANELIGMGVLLVGLLLTRHSLPAVLLVLPVVMLVQFALTAGLAWIIAGVTVFFRDLRQILGVILTLWVFVTPIFYPPSAVPEGLRFLLALNPMHTIVEAYRTILLKGLLPAWEGLVVVGIVGAVMLAMGYLLFSRLKPAFADVL